jgi:hypothetical protein
VWYHREPLLVYLLSGPDSYKAQKLKSEFTGAGRDLHVLDLNVPEGPAGERP